ncbi:hypothetical protein BHE74_00029405 [Ensete ventricosum]|uniref:Uncharacterized protein n=1 Tax=Ensete ventricosum TaxID=4639 RepID=A0A444ERA8_ENSVE|nr:hypothetical protein GW17_00023363 [Ensete ventricosum]RWW63415.1 hypothetical protein BHE74_00029405 [Ensete ventricosum]RZR73424.1 hypothetical protein BHM03_00023955 [Ensete ventricosum]
MDDCGKAIRCQEHCSDTKCYNPCGFQALGDLYRGSASMKLYRGSSLLGFLHND